ncbi:hypothetical protein GWI33_006873 [Rhynchophorus ferrugineus]|uniref:Uncharacterized protein n=1 Tax=Rhynchophorus ferrugineus TaxID=354439 RepID=A0A834IKJ0_RHYFE|nr:hypothetical protein GWI33_006873 [Rhynchophorus ferrugineus]
MTAECSPCSGDRGIRDATLMRTCYWSARQGGGQVNGARERGNRGGSGGATETEAEERAGPVFVLLSLSADTFICSSL